MVSKKHEPVKETVIPWPFWLILLMAFIGGVWAGYFLVWKSLQKIKPEVSKRFAIWGAGVILVYQIILGIIAVNGINASNLSQILLFAIPVWYEFKYFRKWREENPENKPRFSFSAVGWGIVGFCATLLMWTATVMTISSLKL